MNDIMLDKIKCPFRNDIHRICEDRYGSRAWMDVYGIKYRIVDNTLIITNPRENQLIPPTIIDHINALPDGVNVVFNLGYDFNTTGLNLLLEALTNKESNKKIVLDVTCMDFKIGEAISLWDLPNNVSISNTVPLSKNPYFGENAFDWWLLRKSEGDFSKIINKLDTRSKRRALDLQGMALGFYLKYSDILEKKDELGKCRFVFSWIRHNTTFAGCKREGNITVPLSFEDADPIQTYRRGMGVCTGRARLFKTFLNNRYLNIDCYLMDGVHIRTGHEWNEVCLKDGRRLFFDINFSRNGVPELGSCYSEVRRFDYLRNNDLDEESVRPLPPRNREKNKTIPSLPKRRDN